MSTENTEGINGDYAALNKQTAEENGKPSAVAKEMGASAPAPAPTEELALLPDLQMPTGFKLLEEDSGGVEEAAKEPVPSSPGSIAAKLHRNIQRVIDGDTIVFRGERVRLYGVDAPESRQGYGPGARKWLEETLSNASNVEVEDKGKDVYGRKLGKLRVDGVDINKKMVELGLAVPAGGDEEEDSADLFYAGEKARKERLGMWREGEKFSSNPSVFRRFDTSRARYAQAEFDAAMEHIRKRMVPLTLEQREQILAPVGQIWKNADSLISEEDKKAAGVVYLADVVMHLGAVANRYKSVDDIPVRVLNENIRFVCKAFGYKPEDFVMEGAASPYDAIRKLITGAKGIADRVALRQEALSKMTSEELQAEANRAVFGSDESKYRNWTSAQLNHFVKQAGLAETLRTAFENGATGSTVATAVMIAMEEFEDSGAHRVRLSQLPYDQVYKAYEIAQAIRGEYTESWWGKFFISLNNGAEAVVDNVRHTLLGHAFGEPDAKYMLDVLSQNVEDTLIDTSTFGGTVAAGVGGSIPYMLLFASKFLIPVAFVSAYGEAAKIPIEEGWKDYDTATMEGFKVLYAFASPIIELGAIGVAMKPVSFLGKSAAGVLGKSGARLAGFFSTKTLAMKLAGAESKSVLSKLGHGLVLSAHRTALATPGETMEEIADEAFRSGIGLILDPRDEYGRKLYDLERFSDNVIDTAVTALKTVPFMIGFMSGVGTLKEAHSLRRVTAQNMEWHFASGKEIDPLEAYQQAVNEVAAWDAKTRAETLGGLKKEEVAAFFVADPKVRAEILEKTEDKSKKKWLGEIDTYLSYNETIEKNSRNKNTPNGAAASGSSAIPVKRPDVSPAKTFREIEEETRGREGTSEDAKPAEATDADTKKPPQEAPGETKDKSPDASEADTGNAKPVPVAGNAKVPVAQEQSGTGAKPVAAPTAGAKPAEGAKPKTPVKRTPRRKIPVDNKGASATAKKAEKIAGALIDEVKKPKKTTRRKKEDYTPYESPDGAARPPKPKKTGTSGRVKPKKGATMSINDLVRPLSPEIDAALNGGIPKGGMTEDGTVLNPRLVEVFKGAIEESNKTGVGIMDIFAVQYARMLARAAANPDAHQAFLQDPFSWAEGVIDTLVTNARKAKAGDAIAADLLEQAYASREEAEASRRARANAGRMVAHPELRMFVTFARKWLRSVFGEHADIYFIEDLTGETAEQLEVMEAAQAYGGRVNAMIVTESGNVYVSKKANPVKVLHEVFGHGTWEWMKKNNPEGYEKLKELARKAPEEIKRRVKKNYEMDENSEEFLNEVFAHLIEAKYSGRIGTMFKTLAERSWFNDMWDAIVKAIKRAWKGLTGADMTVSPEEFLDELSERFFGYKGIFIGEDVKGSGVKFSLDEEVDVEDNTDSNTPKDENVEDAENPELGKMTDAQKVEDYEATVQVDAEGNEIIGQDVRGRAYGAKDGDSGAFVETRKDFIPSDVSASTVSVLSTVEEETERNPHDLRDTVEEYVGVIDNFFKSLGLEMDVLEDPREFQQTSNEAALTRSNWIKAYIEERLLEDGIKPTELTEEEQRQIRSEAQDAYAQIGEGAAIKPTSGSIGADALEAWVDSKTGVEHAAARALLDVVQMLSADPAHSRVSLTAEDLAMVRNAAETVRGLAETQEKGSTLRRKLLKQACAIEKLEALFIRNSGDFLSVKDEMARFIATMRPTLAIVGSYGDTNVTSADLDLFETPGGKNIKSGTPRILELSVFDEYSENNIRMYKVSRIYKANFDLLRELQDKYGKHPNKYVRESVDEVTRKVFQARDAAEKELGMKPGELNQAVWLIDGVRKDKAEAEAKRMVEESKEAAKDKTITARAEKMAKRIHSRFSILKVVELLSQDDAARAGDTRYGEPMSEKLRKSLESKLVEYLAPGSESRSRNMKGDAWEYYKLRAREFYAGYKAAKARGEIYGDTKAYTDFRAAFKQYLDACELRVSRMIPQAEAEKIIAKANARYEAATAAYIEEMHRTRQRSPSHIIRDIYKVFGSGVAPDGKVRKYEAGDKRLENRKYYVPIEEMSAKELAIEVRKSFGAFREWVSRKMGDVDVEKWTKKYADSYKAKFERARPHLERVQELEDRADQAEIDAERQVFETMDPSMIPSVEECVAIIKSRMDYYANEKLDPQRAFGEPEVELAAAWLDFLRGGKAKGRLSYKLRSNADAAAEELYDTARKYATAASESRGRIEKDLGLYEVQTAEEIAGAYAASARQNTMEAVEKYDELKRFNPVYEKESQGGRKNKKKEVAHADGSVTEEPVISHYERRSSKVKENIESSTSENEDVESDEVINDEDGAWEVTSDNVDEYVPDALPAELRREWMEEQEKAREEGRKPADYNDFAWAWLTRKRAKQNTDDIFEAGEAVPPVPRSWIGIFTRLTPARYEALMKSTVRQTATALELERYAAQVSEVRRQVADVRDELAGRSQVHGSEGELKESKHWTGRRRSGGGILFSIEGDGTEGDGAPTPDEGSAHRERSTFRAIDLSIIFLMRMLSSGRTELTEGECLAMAERYDPYLGGEELRSVIAAARYLAGICREAPGVEKLTDEQIPEMVNNTFENLTKDQFMKLIEALNAVQTDEWKSLSQAYRARLERMERSGRTSDAEALTPEELQDLGVPMRGRSAEASGVDVLEHQEMAPSVNAYNGLARKLFNHFFGSENAPKRSDYKTDEDFEKAEKAYYFKTIESATPEKVAQYRKTLVWLYGKYTTDGFLRKFFTPGVAKVVRRMVQQLRDYADTPTEIFRLAERIERELRSGRQAVNPRTTMEQIRSLVEAFAGRRDPRKAMKNRKISPTAQAFFDAFNEAVNSVDEEQLKKKIGDVSKMTPKEIRQKMHELRQQIKEQLHKKKKEAGEAYESANESETDGASEEIAGNAVRALEELHKQLGYGLALQYLEAKEKYENSPHGSVLDSDKLESEFEHVYNTLVGVASRGRDEVQSHIQEQTAMVEVFVGKVKALLDDAKTMEVDKTGAARSSLEELLRKSGEFVVSGFSLKQRLDEIARFSPPEIQAKLREIFDEFINRPVMLAESRRNQYYHEFRMKFNAMIRKIYGDGKLKDDDVSVVLQVLNTPMEELKKFSANGKAPLTRAQAMAQLAMLLQEDVQRPILELKRRLEAGSLSEKELTEEQKIMLRRMELIPELMKALDELSDGKDLRMIDELVKYYANMAPMLDAVSEKITGMPVSIGSPRYFPVSRSTDYAARKIDLTGRVLGAVPDFLSPRMEITTDINEKADIFSIFVNQAEKQSHFLAFGELHYRMTALFENSDWSRLTNRFLGEDKARLLKGHVQDICAPHLIFVDNSGENAIVGALRTGFAITMLGGNIQSAVKQPLSWSALAHEVGWWKLLRATLRNPWSKENSEIRNMLYNTGDGKLRWGDMFVQVQDAVMKRPGKKSWASKLFAWLMVLQRYGDYLPFFFAGPGLYVAHYGTLRSRINPETGRAFTHEEAQEMAKAMVFDNIEKTQQTNRVSNLGKLQRRGNNIEKMFTQFASSPMLFFAAEARAVRDVVANPKNKEAWKKLAGIVISNHIVMPSLLMGAEIAFGWLFKGDEPDEEDLESWLKLMASGPLSGLVILGMIFTSERRGDVTAPVLSGVNRITRGIGKLAEDFREGSLTEGETYATAGKDLAKLVKRSLPLVRDAVDLGVRFYDATVGDGEDD